MSENKLKPDTGFKLKEDSFLNLLVGGFSLLFFISFFANAKDILMYLLSIVFFIMSIFHIWKAYKSNTILLVNKTGICYYNKFITNWDNFNNAFFKEELVSGYETNHFKTYLYLKYFSIVKDQEVIRKIELTNTQNKSEEEVIAAIKYYYNLSRDY